MAELKPCPFCGTKRYLEYCTTNPYAHWIRCNKCGCQGPDAHHGELMVLSSKEEAIDAWNKRS